MMKKLITFAAICLTLAACSKIETDVPPLVESKGITLTAMLAPKGAPTRALADNGDGKITATWSQGETLAILYNNRTSEAEVTSVDASGAATITFTVVDGTADGTACQIIYPSTATDLSTFAFQNGELSAALDVRQGTGTINPGTPDAGLTLTTPLTQQCAIFKFTLQDEDGAAITARSLMVYLDALMDIQTYVATPSAATGEYYVALPPISGKKMIISAINDAGNSSYRFSRENVSFEAGKYYRSTLKMTVQSDNAAYVPMGDGLKWAVRNVGASKPEDYGDYFAWGETEPYYSSLNPLTWKQGKEEGYDFSSYSHTSNNGFDFTKYTGSDGLSTLVASDDAATKNMGSGWRTPTIDEWEALLARDDFRWIQVKNFNNSGKNGRLVISRKAGFEGNSIFLPAAGVRDWKSAAGAGRIVSYWSSSLDASYPSHAFYLKGSDDLTTSYDMRYMGFSVRGVKKAE